MMSTRSLAAVFLALLAGCYAGPPAAGRPDEFDLLLAERDRYAREIRNQQAKIAWDNRGPRKIDFANDGAVILREWQLYGLPGDEYVHAVFTYDNTTDKTFDRVRVWITVRDVDGQPVSRAWLDLLMPWFDFTPGNTYTTTIRVPTRGVHLQEGWHWTVGCSTHEREHFGRRAIAETEPLRPRYKYSVPSVVASQAVASQACPAPVFPN